MKKLFYKKQLNFSLKTNFLMEKMFIHIKKKKNALQALLPLFEQVPEPTASGKHGVLVMADLEGALDAVWRNAAIYKLQKAGLRNNLMSVFSSLLNDRQSRNLVNSSKCLAINFCEIQDLQT